MRDHKLITGSTRQFFSSHLKSIIMQNTSVPCFEGLDIYGEQGSKFSFSFLSCPSFALVSPEPDDSMRDAGRGAGRERGLRASQKHGDERTKCEKSLSYE